MSRRALITSALVALFLGLAALAPGLPPVRRALLDRAAQVVEGTGMRLDYRSSEGNAWRRIALNDVTLEGFGSNVELDRLELRYFLPSLLGGELPLDVTARGLRGDVDLSDLEELLQQAGDAGGGGGIGPRIVLREVDVSDISLRAQNVPFTLPDATISDLRLLPEPGGLLVGARVSTVDGELQAEGHLALPSFDFNGEVTSADVSIAQRWWPGAVAGTIRGPVSFRRGQLQADLQVQDGVIEQSGVRITNVTGQASMLYPRITAELTGVGLGGPVSAAGTVDIAAQRYDVTGEASPQLAAAAAWLEEFLDLDELPVAVEGSADVEARVSGWQAPTIVATATGAGSAGGLALQDLSARLDLAVGGRLRADLSAQLGGGGIEASIAPGPAGNRLQVTATGVRLDDLEVAGFAPGGLVERLQGRFDLSGSPTGTLVGAWSGELLGRPASLELDGDLNADGLQAFFSATADLGTGGPLSVTGAAVLADERLEAGLSVADLLVPGLSRPLRLGLSASGPLSRLALGVTVDNERPVLLDLALFDPDGLLGATAPIDLRGRATGRLEGGAVRDVTGSFGPITLNGEVGLQPLAAVFDVAMSPIALLVGSAEAEASTVTDAVTDTEGDTEADTELSTGANTGANTGADTEADTGANTEASSETDIEDRTEESTEEITAANPDAASVGAAVGATLSIPSGTLTYSDGRLALDAQAQVTDAHAGPVLVDLGTLNLQAGAQLGEPAATGPEDAPPPPPGATPQSSTGITWSLEVTAPDDRLALSLDSNGGPFAARFASVPVRLGAGAEPTLVSGTLVQGPGGTFTFEATLPPGSRVAGLQLSGGADLEGEVLTSAERVDLRGTVGDLPVVASVGWAEEVTVTAETGGLDASFTPGTGAWRLAGDAPLAPVLAELGLNGVEANFAGDVGYVASEGYVGAAAVQLTSLLPLEVTLTGSGEQLAVAVAGEVGGVPVSGEGALTDPLLEALSSAFAPAGEPGTSGAPTLLVDLGPLRDLTLDLDGIRGAGEVPALDLGPATAGPVPWSLAFDWSEAAGFVEASGSTLQVALRDGALEVSGELAADLTYGDAAYRVTVGPDTALGATGDTLRVGSVEELVVSGALRAVDDGSVLATFGGTPSDMAVELAAPLERLAAPLPADVRPAGELRATARLDLLAGPRYSGELSVTAPAPLGGLTAGEATDAPADSELVASETVEDEPEAVDIAATFAGVGASFEVDVTGAGLSLSHTPGEGPGAGRFTLVADDLSLAQFLPPDVGATVDGALSYAAEGWSGSLTAHLTALLAEGAAVVLDASLDGAGDTLELTLEGTGPAATQLTASGPLLPRPYLEGRLSALDGAVEGDLTWDDGLDATLVTTPVVVEGVLALPAQTVSVGFDLESGVVTARAADDRLDLRLAGGELSGTLAVPLDLLGAGTLVAAEVTGSLTDPRVQADIQLTDGPAAGRIATLQGSLGQGASITATLSPEQLTQLVPAATAAIPYLAGPIDLEAELSPDLAWSARATADVAPTDSARMTVVADLTGEALAYEGVVALTEASGQLASVTLSGEAADATARLDLAGVDWEGLGEQLGLPLQIDGRGEVVASTAPLAVTASLDLTGRVGDATINLRGVAPDDLTLSLVSPAASLEGRLAWATTAAGGGTITLLGDYGGKPLRLDLFADPGFASGRLEVEAGDAHLQARLSSDRSGAAPEAQTTRRVTVTADVPPGSWAAPGGTAEAELSIEGGTEGGTEGSTVTLETLSADLVGLLGAPDEPGTGAHLEMRGSLTPALDLRGIVTTPLLDEPAALALNDTEGLSARLAWRGIEATVDLTPELAVTLDGSASDDDVAALLAALAPFAPPELLQEAERVTANLEVAGLGWSAAQGWSGGAVVTAEAPHLPWLGAITVRAFAEEGQLKATALASTQDGGASASPATGAAPTEPTALGTGVPNLSLRADATLGGSLGAPTVTGSLTLGGAVEAAGTLEYAGGVGGLRLEGSGLTLSADLGANGVSVEAQARSVPLDEWLPQLPEGRLSFDATLAGSQVIVDAVLLEAPRSRLTGGATLELAPASGGGPTLRAAFDADLDLSALEVGDVGLQGRVRGPLVVTASDLGQLQDAEVIANLAMIRLGVDALAGGSVSGNVSVGGKVADPEVTMQLVGDGSVGGSLLVDARPLQGEVEVRSSLTAFDLASDLRLNLANGAVRANGTVSYGDAILLFSEAPGAGTASELRVTGAGRLDGIEARVAADLSRATIGGNLAGLGAGLAGEVHLELGGQTQWLSGQVSGVQVAGVQLGDLSVTSQAPADAVTVSGDALTAVVDPLGGAWSATLLGLTLGEGPGAPTLSAEGEGVLASGYLDAHLEGPEFDLIVQLQHGDETSVAVEGSAYGGEALLVGARGEGGTWQGSGYFQGGSLAGFELSAEIDLLGSELLPQAVLRTRAANGFVVQGNATAGPSGVTLDQFVQGGPLQRTLRVQGRLLPGTELTISSLDVQGAGPVSAAEAAQATVSSVRLAGVGPDATSAPGLRATGDLQVPIGPVSVRLSGQNDTPTLGVELLGLPRWRLAADLPATDLLGLVGTLMDEGLTLHGQDALAGTARVDPSDMSVTLEGFALDFAGLAVTADGSVGLAGADLTGEVAFETDLPVAGREGGYRLPWHLTGADGAWQLVSDGPDGHLEARYALDGDLAVSVDMVFSEGRVVGQLGLPEGGLSGTLSVAGVRLLSPELGGVSVDVEATVAEGRVGGTATLANEAGRITLSGSWGLAGIVPDGLAPGAPSGGRLEARLRTLELSEVPAVARLVPHLSGEISGVAQLRDGFLFGQLVAPEIDVAGLTTPLEVAFSGPPNDLNLTLQVRAGLGSATLAGGQLSGMMRFERFPLNLLSAAVVGPTDYTADMTGVMRVDLPLADPLEGYLRLATEEVRLARMGVPTVGNVTVTYEDRALLVERAEFTGRGRWEARGVLRSDLFDFQLEANEADFTPLLGLVPALARLGLGAAGSFDLSVGGDAANPSVSLTSPGLELAVAGSRFRLENTEVGLEGVSLTLESTLRGLRPVAGTLELSGGAYLSLLPFALRDLEVALAGDADLAGFGTVTGITGALHQEGAGAPTLSLTGIMGTQPLTVTGTLDPLELRATGSGLNVALPSLLVADAVVDADLRLTTEEGGVAVGGTVVASEVILDPAARAQAPAPQTAEESESLLPDQLVEGVEAPPSTADAPQQAGGLAALRFDELSIRAPGRVMLSTNLGSFEAGLDLTLTGTGADPRLSGSASALRGNLRFSGREFTIERAVANFAPNRGVFPELDVAATTEFDKSRVLSAAPSVSFAAPREGSTFDVRLAFTGPIERAESGGIHFDIRPALSSNAMIEVPGENAGGTGVRPFTEAELMSLITLGRFELNADLIGAGGLGEAVAQGAIDTAVDLLVVSGLEGALREALGLDVVEIRTSSVSSLLEEGAQPFGVSVRVGGYLNPELFASYRIGTNDDGDPSFGLTNEVLLRYALGPLDLDIIGRVDFPTAGTLGSPRPELGVLLGYQFSSNLGIDTGVTLGTNRSRLEFGVTLRW